MFSSINLSKFYSAILNSTSKPDLYTKEIQASIKHLLDNSIVSKLTITIHQPESFCNKKQILENVCLYDSNSDFIPTPQIFSYTTPFNGECQIMAYIQKNEVLNGDDKLEFELFCNLIYTLMERSYMKNMLSKAGNIDSSTGVLNLSGFKNIGMKITERHLMPKFAVIFMNIINFKGINQKYGHDTGTLILKLYSQKISAFLEKNGSIARLGGDNFAILIKKSYLGKLLKFLEEVPVTFETNDSSETVGISVRAGITEGNRNFPVFEAYLGCAQEALQSAIKEDIDNFVFF